MMAVKMLGQASPAAATLTTLYTAPTPATSSTLLVCNTNTASVTFRVRFAAVGATDALTQAIYHDVTLAANDTFASTIGMTFSATDALRVQASVTGVVFTLFGQEV
jgi:hypothetical protein